MGAVLQQQEGSVWKPLGYFSKRLSEAQRKYSSYDRELLAIYLAIAHFRYMVEGRDFVVYTDHTPLTFVFSKLGSAKELPRRTRQIRFISEFTTNIRHVSGNGNVVADTSSVWRRLAVPHPSTSKNSHVYKVLTDQQLMQSLSELSDNLQFKQIMLLGSNQYVICETSTKKARPSLTEIIRRLAFDTVPQPLNNLV